MARLIGVELFKLRKRLLTKVLISILVGLLVVIYLLLFAFSRTAIGHAPQGGDAETIRSVLGLGTAIPFGYEMLQGVGTILAIILIGGAVGSEYGWGTVRTLLLCSESRWRFLVSKLVAVMALVFVGMGVGLAVSVVMSLITTTLAGGSISFDFLSGSYVWAQFSQFWRTYYAILLYVLAAFFFAVWGRSTLAGIGLGIGIFVLEGILTPLMRLAGGWIGHIPEALLSANVDSLMQPNKSGLPMEMSMGGDMQQLLGSMPDTWQAALVVAGYCLLFLALGLYLFQKRDITASS